MDKTPLFFEATDQIADERLCIGRHLWGLVLQQGLTTLPFATNIEELQQVLSALKKLQRQPSLFVINTYRSERWLKHLDFLIEDTPVLYLRREISWLKNSEEADPEAFDVTMKITEMRPRLTTIWYYGSMNGWRIASKLNERVKAFLQNGDFSSLEGQDRNQFGLNVNRTYAHALSKSSR